MPTVEAASPATPAPAAAPAPGAPATPPAAETPPAPAETPPPARDKPRADPSKVRAILEERANRGKPTSARTPPAPAEAEAAPAAAEPPKKPDPGEGDPDLALRLARIATAEDRARVATAEAKKVEAELREYRAWKETKARDPLAVVVQNLTPEQQTELYWKLNDHVLKSDPDRPKDPAELARQAAREEWERLDKERQERERGSKETQFEQARTWYVGEVAKTFDASPAKWPAIAARGVAAGDIHAFAEAEFKRTGTAPDAATVLDHFQREYEAQFEAQGYTRRKVEAQPGGEKPRSGTTTVTQEWSAGAGAPSSKPDSEKSLRELREEIKRKHNLR